MDYNKMTIEDCIAKCEKEKKEAVIEHGQVNFVPRKD